MYIVRKLHRDLGFLDVVSYPDGKTGWIEFLKRFLDYGIEHTVDLYIVYIEYIKKEV